jgi:hypothetical protein
MKRAAKKLPRLVNVSGISSLRTDTKDLRGCASHPETSDCRDSARDEDGSTTPSVLVENWACPATNKGRAKVRSAVGETFHPFVCDVEFIKVEFL